ncbi:hypothetical protein, partial [Desulfovibrio sp.]|uniref:hypothetical protein n=1 Tax=Desulfovibrio sp. TaxID=885 RepID=UPI0025C6B14F
RALQAHMKNPRLSRGIFIVFHKQKKFFSETFFQPALFIVDSITEYQICQFLPLEKNHKRHRVSAIKTPY